MRYTDAMRNRDLAAWSTAIKVADILKRDVELCVYGKGECLYFYRYCGALDNAVGYARDELATADPHDIAQSVRYVAQWFSGASA